jgi:hypothetical protein
MESTSTMKNPMNHIDRKNSRNVVRLKYRRVCVIGESGNAILSITAEVLASGCQNSISVRGEWEDGAYSNGFVNY